MWQLKQEVIDYLDQYIFVNEDEVLMALNDYLMESTWEQLSINDLFDVEQWADYYIQLRDLHFDPDLVCTIDYKNKQLHIQDLNHQFTNEQVAKKEKQRNVAFLNACDCLHYWYWINARNTNWLDEEERQCVRQWAIDYMAKSS